MNINKKNMKKLVFWLFLLNLQQTLTGQTIVNSNIIQSATWSPSGSPYLIESAITVNSNASLTILPGTIIKIKNFSGSLTGQGDIVALGTDTQPIIFTSQKDDTAGGDSNNDGSATTPAPEDWRFVAINSSGSQFKHCEFRYGGSAPTGGDGAGALRIGVDITIENCVFFKNRKGLVVLDNAKPLLKSCRFQENLRVPFSRMLGADPSFENCEFIGNQYNGVGLEPADFNGYSGNYTLSPPGIIGLNATTYIVGFFEKIELKLSSSLNILPDVIIKFANFSQGITADGTLNAEGTPTKPIIFTSLKDDTSGGDTNNDGIVSMPNSEDWPSVSVASNNTMLKYCEFKYGGSASSGGDGKGGLRVSANATIENCLFFKNRKGLVVLDNSKPAVKNCTFKENLRTPVSRMLGAEPLLESCTFLNNQYDAVGLEPADFNGYTGQYEIAPLALSGLNGWAYFIQSLEKIDLKPGAQLRIKPGVIIKTAPFSNGLSVSGTLAAEGTKDNPIVFTSYKDDYWGGDSNKDGTSTQPGFDDWPGILLQGPTASNSVLKHCLFRFGGNSSVSGNQSSLKLKDCQPNIKNCTFESNGVGLRTEISGVPGLVDSCLFKGNKIGAKVFTGSLTIQNGEFERNITFNIENLSPEDVTATGIWWGVDNYLALLNDPNSNLPLLFDKKDDPSKGNILINNPTPPQSGIRSVTPGEVVIAQVTAKINVLGYPFENGATVRFKKAGTSDIFPSDTIHYINVGSLEFDLDLSDVEPGFYDLVITNPGGDSLELKSAISVLNETGVPFDEWIPFSVTNGHVYAGKVVIPPMDELFVLVKKSDRIGFVSTWKGAASLYSGSLRIATSESFSYPYAWGNSDQNIQLKTTKPGLYNFEVQTTNEKGNGFIKFTRKPDTLTLNEWGKGEVLRPHGYDWKAINIPPGIDTLTLRTEGIGVESTLEVFKDSLKSNQKWLFYNWGSGYKIVGKIPNPAPGLYLIRYKDSAVLQSSVNSSLPTDIADQRREYLIFAGGNVAVPSPGLALKIHGLSTYQVGQAKVDLFINGAGFDSLDQIKLIKQGINDVIPKKTLLSQDKKVWKASIDFSNVSIGDWSVLILNTSGDSAFASRPLKVNAIEDEDISVDILTRETARAGRCQPVIFRVKNNSNVNIFNAKLGITFSPVVELCKGTIIPRLTAYDTIVKDSNWIYFDPTWTSWDDVPLAYDILDSTTGKFYTGILLILPVIGPYQEKEIHLNVKFLSVGDVEVNVNGSVINGLGFKGLTSLQESNGSDCFIKITDFVLNKLEEQANPANDVEDCINSTSDFLEAAEEFNKQANQFQFNCQIDNQGSTPTCIKEYIDPPPYAYTDVAVSGVSSFIDCAGVAGAIVPEAKLAKVLKDLIEVYNNAREFQDLYEACKDEIENLKNMIIKVVGSITPEDKIGPLGFDLKNIDVKDKKHFLSNDQRFDYRIDYWNREDATSPAAEVFIRDTLDADFDPTTLNFTSFGFLRWEVPLEGGQYFNTIVDLRPDFDLLVNVEGSFDPSTREVYWVHRSLDPQTLELPDDPTAGYLPPIDSTGYNIGWVNFSVKPKPNMPSKTVFTNQARVNFDGVGPWGPAPPYGPYTNVFDFDAPQSAVTMLAPQTSTAAFEVNWAGDDGDGCGIRSYTVYVSENGADYYAWLVDTSATSAVFNGTTGNYYNFYSEATDNLGNKEQETPHVDASTLIVSTYTPTQGGELPVLFQNIPNPFSSSTQIPFYLPKSSRVQIEILDLLGRRIVVADQEFGAGINTLQLSKNDLPSGSQMLICKLRTGNLVLLNKMLMMN
jgi:parallel beta-helix repeat protein